MKGYLRATSEAVRELSAEIFSRLDDIDNRLAEIPAPLKGDRGDPGESIVGPKGEKGDSIVGPVGPPGQSIKAERGERGEKGESIIGPQGDPGNAGPIGPKGEQGDSIQGPMGPPGERGKDAVEIDILPGIDLARSYPRGTFARHDGGVIRSFRTTIPGESLEKAGWEVILAGLSAIEIIQQEDPRCFILRSRITGGLAQERQFRLPVLVYRGIYAQGKYLQGDVVTWGGSAWHCQVDGTTSAPSNNGKGNGDWKLMVKEGQRAKDGKDGERGPQGPPGPPGRDLTQMSFDGSKH